MMPSRSRAGWRVAGVAAVALLVWVVLRPAPAPEGERADGSAPAPSAAPAAPVLAPVVVAPPPSVPPPSAPPSEAPPPRPAAIDPMERLRAIVDSDPAAALALAQEEAQRSPNSPVAEERSFRTMQALVHVGQISAARGEATTFFEQHPESPWGERVERLTGVHPRRYYQNPR